MPEVTLAQAMQIAIGLHQNGRIGEAEAIYRQVLAQQPDHAEALQYLGVAAAQVGRPDAAIDLLRQAITLQPNYPLAYYNLGNACKALGRFDNAIGAYRQAIAQQPNSPAAYNNLGLALQAAQQLDAAIGAYRQAVILEPNLPEPYANLGNTLRDVGQLDTSIAAYRQALALRPDWSAAHSNLLYTLHFHPDYDGRAILAEHREWDRRYAAPFAAEAAQPHDHERSPERRLRLGYVSGDFGAHFTARLIDVLLAGHDRAAFEIFCYSNVHPQDTATRKLESYGHTWRNIYTMDDAQVAAAIRADRIDILVDLSQHTAGHRLLVFARKPAPIQVAYLGCPATAGVGTIDYRISDPYVDPPGVSEADNSEKLMRLGHFYFCYPAPGAEPVGELPALRNGWVTFGCLNRRSKITAPVLELWCALLKRVPASRLVLMTHGSAVSQEGLCQTFAGQGIARERIMWAAPGAQAEFLGRYNQVDISLDPFPHNGHMSSCDSIWMGVPLVTLRGRTSVARWGASLLSNLQLDHLIADSPERYVEVAERLAKDLPALAELRGSLRQRMQDSPIMAPGPYVRDVEMLYRQMWREWCARK